MAVVDVYDALRSQRVYKPAFSHQKSCKIIQAESGRHFDADLTDIFIKFEAEFEEISNSL